MARKGKRKGPHCLRIKLESRRCELPFCKPKINFFASFLFHPLLSLTVSAFLTSPFPFSLPISNTRLCLFVLVNQIVGWGRIDLLCEQTLTFSCGSCKYQQCTQILPNSQTHLQRHHTVGLITPPLYFSPLAVGDGKTSE